MPPKSQPKCIEPKIGRLMPELFTGALASVEFKSDRSRLLAHTKQCPACHSKMMKDVYKNAIVPALKDIARRRGLAFEEVCEQFSKFPPKKIIELLRKL